MNVKQRPRRSVPQFGAWDQKGGGGAGGEGTNYTVVFTQARADRKQNKSELPHHTLANHNNHLHQTTNTTFQPPHHKQHHHHHHHHQDTTPPIVDAPPVKVLYISNHSFLFFLLGKLYILPLFTFFF